MIMGELITAREAMSRAIARAELGEIELARMWLDIARELRVGSGGVIGPPLPKPVLLDAGQRYEDEPSASADSDIDTFYGYTLGQAGSPSQTAFAAAVRQRKALDRGEPMPHGFGETANVRDAVSRIVDEILSRRPQASLDDTVVAVNAFGPDGLQRVADVLRGDPGDIRQRWTNGALDADAQRFAAGAGGVRPYIETSDETRSFDAFATGRASVSAERALFETAILSAGDPNHCRFCGFEIYEVNPSDVGTQHRHRHVVSGQAMCPTPPRHTDDAGDESYVTGSHTMAEPGGIPYGQR